MIRRILIFSALLTMVSCGGSSKSVEDKNETKAELSPFYCDEIAEVDEVEAEEDENYTKTQILNYELINNCVCIKYQFSGCVEGERMLIWDGEYNESNRPEVMMELLVRDAGMCEQLLTDSACFSMKKMMLVGNEILVFLNNRQNNFLLDYNTRPERDFDDED